MTPLEAAAAEAKPGIARLSQIDATLKSDPAIAPRIGAETVGVTRRDLKVVPFTKLGFDVTVALMTANIEPLNADKKTILEMAIKVLSAIPVTPKVVTPTPEPVKTTEPEPPKEERGEVEESPPEVARTAQRTARPAKAKTAPTAESTAAAEQQAAASDPQVNICLCIFSLLATANELAERDKKADSAKRRKLLSDTIQAYRAEI